MVTEFFEISLMRIHLTKQVVGDLTLIHTAIEASNDHHEKFYSPYSGRE